MMPELKTEMPDDIEEKLAKLDQVNKIINGMKNENISQNERNKFVEKADQLIKQEEDKTVIKYDTGSTILVK